MEEKNTIHSMADFAEAVKTAACREFPDKKAIIENVPKNNGVCPASLCIFMKGCHASPNIYLEPYYEKFKAGRGFEDICREIFAEYTKHAADPELEDYAAGLADFGKSRNNICYRLINAEKNRELLKEIPHRPFLDLAVAYFVRLPLPEERGITATALIRNNMMESWGTDESSLYGLARKNTPRIGRGKVIPLESILNEYMETSRPETGSILSFKDYDITINFQTESPLYAATNTANCHGAAVILYEGLLRNFAEKTGSSFFILPSSIHELLFLPDTLGTDVRDISDMVKSVNTAQVSPEEFLSNSVYYYHADTGRLEIAA